MGATYISAGAGSGKTFRLTHLLADRLVPKEPGIEPVDASGIILTTFTKSAAADFIRKAREVLIDKKDRPDKAAELDGALIGTVHSICERFIRKYWFELGLALPLKILSNEDKKLFMSRIAETVVKEDDVLFFSEFAREFDMNEDFWKQSIAEIINQKCSFGIEDFPDSRRASEEFIDGIFKGDAPDDEAFTECVTPFLELLLQDVWEDNVNSDVIDKEESTGMKRQRALERILSGSASRFLVSTHVLSIVDPTKEAVFKKDFWKSMVMRRMDPNVIVSTAEQYVTSREIGNRLKECTDKLFDLAEAWENEYDQFKVENGLLDFNDMEQRFIRLLTEDKFENVRKDIKDTYKVMMVDEFQDSNPVQIKIFSKLMELVNETVFVGDEKQAIFGFRGTERSLVKDFVERIPCQDSLKASFRSRPELVRAANDIFCNAYGVEKHEPDPDDPSAPYDGLSLYPDRKSYDDLDPALQHWNVPVKDPTSPRLSLNYLAVGEKIRQIVGSGTFKVVRKVKDETGKEKEVLEPIRHGDIAILLRNGTSIGKIAQNLREAGVPVSIQEKDFIGWAEVQLILSLIRYLINPNDLCAKADIMHLIGGMSTESIIKSAVKGSECFESPLFERLKAIRSRISVLSVSEIVESLALELDLYGNTLSWGLSETRVRNLDFLAFVAQEYEQLCANMNSAPSLPGFIAYVTAYQTEGHKVDRADTVKILTCHSAKGLEWPMVILDELTLDISDQTIAKQEIRGVHCFRKKGGNQVHLLVFPEILYKKNDKFGSSQNIPQPILVRMAGTEYFLNAKNRKKEEEKNVLYVAFTRAKDYLVTLGYWIKSNDKKKADRKSKYTWLTECNAGGNPVLGDNGFTLWHSNHPSFYVDIPEPEEPDTQEGRQLQAWEIPEEKDFGDKYISPSRHDNKATSFPNSVILTEIFQGERMVHNISGEEEEADETGTDSKSARCGTCIHHVFAAYNPERDRGEMVEMARRIIEGMGLADEFPSPESVIDSAAQFFGWLRERYGEGTPLHELPVVMKQEDGTVIRGDMDLVWDLPDGNCILVDYKSFHSREDLPAIKAHACKQGYPGQLKKYKDTLESGTGPDRRKVREVLIYYFVQGKVVRFEF